MIPELSQDIRSRKTNSGGAARYFAQNFEAVIDMLIKLAGEATVEHFLPGHIKTHSKTPIRQT